jgi:hypothetical protein
LIFRIGIGLINYVLNLEIHCSGCVGRVRKEKGGGIVGEERM